MRSEGQGERFPSETCDGGGACRSDQRHLPSTKKICATPPPPCRKCSETPIDRLTTELRRARVVYDSDYIHNQAKKRLAFEAIDHNTEENNEDTPREVDKCVESTTDLSKEMQLAGKEILEASRRAEIFLADLECRQDNGGERGDEGSSSRHEISVSNCTNDIQSDPASPVYKVETLLQEIAVLKQHVKETKGEVAELRSALSSRTYATQSHITPDISTPRRRVIPAEVLLNKEAYADGDTQSNISSIRHHDYKNYKEEEGEDGDSDSMCGNNPCMFGGLIKMIFRERKEFASTSRSILSRHEEGEEN